MSKLIRNRFVAALPYVLFVGLFAGQQALDVTLANKGDFTLDVVVSTELDYSTRCYVMLTPLDGRDYYACWDGRGKDLRIDVYKGSLFSRKKFRQPIVISFLADKPQGKMIFRDAEIDLATQPFSVTKTKATNLAAK